MKNIPRSNTSNPRKQNHSFARGLFVVFADDNFEITHSVENGFHLHNHITYGCTPAQKLDLQKNEDELTKLWSFYIKKNGFSYISKKYGVSVRETTMGMHSGGHYPTKSLDELTAKNSTLEYYEKKLDQYIRHNYPLPDNMNKDEIKNIIKQELEIFHLIPKGRIHENT